MNAINSIPAAYRPRGLGPNQQRWLERKFPQITKNVVRTKSHHKDCPHVHTVSAYVCGCNVIERKP
jgi:hypothetical protein